MPVKRAAQVRTLESETQGSRDAKTERWVASPLARRRERSTRSSLGEGVSTRGELTHVKSETSLDHDLHLTTHIFIRRHWSTMGKAGKRRRDEYYAEQSRYVRELGVAATAVWLRFADHLPPVSAFQHVGPFGPTPDDRWIYFVVPSEADARLAEATSLTDTLRAQLVAELEAREYPASGRSSLTVRIVSQKAIDAGGGSFAFFR